jgi:predicted metalloprotease with PDZ domain
MEPNLPPVRYHVNLFPSHHELGIEVAIDSPAVGQWTRLEVPTWVPGDYEFMPFARDLFAVTAKDEKTGAPLTISRDGWQAFRVHGAGNGIRVSYRAYAYSIEFAEACGILDHVYGVLLGGRYLRVSNWPGPCRVTYEIPSGWRVHHSAGAARVAGDNAWDYPSYESLIDSPVVMGGFDLLQREVGGKTFYFAFVDRTLGYESQVDMFIDGVAAVCRKFHEIFGSFPFENYTFVLSCHPSLDWGLEHLTSSMCGLGPEVFIDRQQWATGIRVCAHELFHAWNVRRLRPAPLKKLNLGDGTYTEGLWLAEGFTRYYEFLSCARTGVYTANEFFSSVVNYYTHLSRTPAYGRVTAVDSSLATFANHSKYAGRCNNSIDYYDKGMLIAFTVDVELRLNKPSDSLDEAFRVFYEKYVGSDLGYTTDDVVRFFEQRHTGLGDIIARQATAPSGLVIEEQLQRLGFRVQSQPARYLGLMFQQGSGASIFGVLDDSPAGESGIAPNDVLTEVNSYPFTMKGLIWAAQNSDQVTLAVHRGQRSLTFKVTPREYSCVMTLVWVGDDEQAERIQTWLERPEFKPKPGGAFGLEFYENFHGIETVV